MPNLSTLSALKPSVFAQLAERRAQRPHKVLPLHIGDTFLLPPVRLSAPADPDDPALYLYRDPAGELALRQSFAADLRERRGISLSVDEIIVTGGATHGLLMALQAILSPGEEAILAAPYWTLFPGLVRIAGGVPVEASLFSALSRGEDAGAFLSQFGSAKTRAIYYASPNNPDGTIVEAAALASLVALAKARDWWIFADEVYEPFVYEGSPAMPAHPLAPERVITSYSMSKSHALAGLRLGFMTGPAPLIAALRRLMTYTLFNVPLYGQRVALEAIAKGPSFLETARASYRQARDLVCSTLDSSFVAPRAGAYVFLDLRRESRGDIWKVIDAALDAGVSLAPGSAFGAQFAEYARLCFTAAPLDDLAWGIPRLNEALARCRA
jgi:aspartate/methionine/tyrosine aminotransferase